MVVANPHITSRDIGVNLQESGVKVSRMTISRRLKLMNLSAYKPARKPMLTKALTVKRIHFANQYRHWTENKLQKVMWSDECSITQFGERVSHVRRPIGARYNERYTVPTMKHPASIMIWGCVSSYGCGALVSLEKM